MNVVLVTGGEGFVGHHIINVFLKETDFNIISLDVQYNKNFNRLDYVLSQYDDLTKKRLTRLYINSSSGLNIKSFLEKNIINSNYIIHCAALANVDDSIKDPTKTIKENIDITLEILEYARTLKNLKRFINISTESVFGPIDPNQSFKEYDRYNSINPYGASKAATEEISIAYASSYDIPLCIARLTTQIGERARNALFLSKLINNIYHGNEVIIHGDKVKNIFNTNKYMYVKETAKAILFILNLNLDKVLIEDPYRMHKIHKFNIALDEGINTFELAQLVAKIMNKDLNYSIHESISGRPKFSSLDGSFLKSLGWSPVNTLSESIEIIVNWYLQNKEWIQ
jgi:nucleoside-diphosphate-sugar epimerase